MLSRWISGFSIKILICYSIPYCTLHLNMGPSVHTWVRCNMSPLLAQVLFPLSSLNSDFVVALNPCSWVPRHPSAVSPLQVGPTPHSRKHNCSLRLHWAPAHPWHHCPLWLCCLLLWIPPLMPPPRSLDTMVISVPFTTSRRQGLGLPSYLVITRESLWCSIFFEPIWSHLEKGSSIPWTWTWALVAK